ncbi:MAG: carboxylating nicotinate-nucleotide diphosphorylase [Terrimicrobiaceae bacterium]
MTPQELVAAALREDVGTGDVTSEIFIPSQNQACAAIVSREPCVVAGTSLAADVFSQVDPAVDVNILQPDGSTIETGAIIMDLHGPARSILTGERVALNFLQRLSGVASVTRRFVDAIAGTSAKILDTRKTTPGWRTLEKAAVVAGGGTNHRMGLHDMVMVKDNHLAAGGGPSALQPGIDAAKARGLRVEIEVDNLEQYRTVIQLHGVDVILLDNMSLDELRMAVSLKPPGIQLEASGGITLANARAVALTGVDFLSIGALTHSAPSIDLGMDFSA